jgi:DNA helicase HerA-like ATPase
LLDQLEAIIKLIRSKGIGIVFITQSPDDIPESILGQLGMKIQHALRAFTAKDRKAIKLAAENYPDSEFYTINELITEMGIGEAFVSVLNTKGIPTPLVHTLMRPPQSRMDVLTDSEIDGIISRSHLVRKYNVESDPQSAYEILSAKIAAAQEEANQEQLRKEQEKAAQATTGGRGREEKSIIEQVATSSAGKQVFRTLAREVTRGLLGMLGFGGKRR